MAWIEVHQTLPNHRKVLLVAERLDVEEAQVVGHLVTLWLWALDNAPGGLLPASRRTIERAAIWPGQAGAFLEALLEAGLIDRDGEELRIHDWHEYGGKLQEQRVRNREKQERYRQKSQQPGGNVTVTETGNKRGQDGNVTVTSPDGDGHVAVILGDGDGHTPVTSPSELPSHNPPTLHNPTQHDPTGELPPEGPPSGADAPAQAQAGEELEKPEKPADPPKRKRRLADDFVPSSELMRFGREKCGLDDATIARETEKFTDHFRASGDAKLDWPAAWRNWMRRVAEGAFGRASPGHHSPTPPAAPWPPDRELTEDEMDAAADRWLGRTGTTP